MSSTALRGLHSALCTRPQNRLKYLVKYILTSRLTQDFVENFSQIRGMGGTNTHPKPVEIKTRVRLLLMGASPAVAAGSSRQPSASGASVAMEESPTYLSASALQDLGGEEVAAAADAPDGDLQEMNQLLEEVQTRQSSSVPGCTQPANQTFSREALGYVAWFLAYKCADIDSSLGTISSQCVPDQAGPSCEWVSELGQGGLSLPSPQWMRQVKACETVFCAMHGAANIDRGPDVVRRLWDELELKFSSVYPRVLRKYAVTRTHIRLRWLQRELERERSATKSHGRNAKRMRPDARSTG